jgi:hypothetical protein
LSGRGQEGAIAFGINYQTNGRSIQEVKLLQGKIMFNIEGVLSHEIKYEITRKQLAYIFTKFLSAHGAYKDFIREYMRYHKSKTWHNSTPKDVIDDSICNLKLDGRSIKDMITAYSSAFNWWDTNKGSIYWAALNDKWYDVTKRRFLKEIYVI